MTVLKFIAIVVIGLYLIIGIGVYFFQEKLIFLPEELPKDFQFEFDTEFQEHFIEMSDGAVINVLHFQLENPRGLILYFHGNAGSLERWGEVVTPFVSMGFEVLIMDYRGYGKSTGDRTKQKMLSDADQLYDFAKTLVSEDSLVVYGRSIGSSFASYVAGKNSPSKLILETPFYSLADVAKNVIPIYPSFLIRFNFKNYQSLASATCPIFIFHGTEDEVVPLQSGQNLFRTLDPETSEFFVIKGGAHNNLINFAEYRDQVRNVLLDE